MKTVNKGFYSRFVKRPMDFFLAIPALIILSPVFLFVSILVWFKLEGSILFYQERPGLHEKVFTIYKFRSMVDYTDNQGNLLPKEQRLTKFGRFLRSTSLDELPELINVLKGDMSLVGPRPLLVSYLSLYNQEQKRRHEVKPGLTGLAQANGRHKNSWEQRLKLDVQYVDHVTFIGDCKIILTTFKNVLLRKNTNR